MASSKGQRSEPYHASLLMTQPLSMGRTIYQVNHQGDLKLTHVSLSQFVPPHYLKWCGCQWQLG